MGDVIDSNRVLRALLALNMIYQKAFLHIGVMQALMIFHRQLYPYAIANHRRRYLVTITTALIEHDRILTGGRHG